MASTALGLTRSRNLHSGTSPSRQHLTDAASHCGTLGDETHADWWSISVLVAMQSIDADISCDPCGSVCCLDSLPYKCCR